MSVEIRMTLTAAQIADLTLKIAQAGVSCRTLTPQNRDGQWICLFGPNCAIQPLGDDEQLRLSADYSRFEEYDHENHYWFPDVMLSAFTIRDGDHRLTATKDGDLWQVKFIRPHYKNRRRGYGMGVSSSNRTSGLRSQVEAFKVELGKVNQ